MKQTDRLKKEKSPTVKTTILANTKKTEPKKTLKKEDVPIPKSTPNITQPLALPLDTPSSLLESPRAPNHQSSSIQWPHL
jgi:hypothetical protein